MSVETLLAVAIGTLSAAGIYLLLRERSFSVILGLTLLSYATNLFIFAMGRVRIDRVPILRDSAAHTIANHSDPLPQALVLTAIVIGFALTALVLAIALRVHDAEGSDRVDAQEPS